MFGDAEEGDFVAEFVSGWFLFHEDGERVAGGEAFNAPVDLEALFDVHGVFALVTVLFNEVFAAVEEDGRDEAEGEVGECEAVFVLAARDAACRVAGERVWFAVCGMARVGEAGRVGEF